MNRLGIFIFICFLFFSQLVFGQGTFQKVFKFGNYSDLIFPNRIDKTCIGVLQKNPFDPGYLHDHFSIVKMDDMGNIHWVKKVHTPFITNTGIYPFLCQDNNYLMLSKTDSGNDRDDQAIIKIDTNGNVLWSKKYSIGGLVSFTAELEDAYVICGFYNNPTSIYNDILVLKISKTGELMWSKNYGGIFSEEAFSIVPQSDGSISIAGWSGSYSTNGEDDIFILTIDTNGNILWTKTFGGDGKERAYKIFQNKNGELMCIGLTQNSFSPSGDIYILKLTNAGDIVWSKTYDISYFDYAANTCAYVDSNDNIIFSGMTYGMNMDALVMKVSTDGNVIFAKTFNNSEEEAFLSMMRDEEYIYSVAWYYDTTASVYNQYIVKSDVFGNANCNETDVVPFVTDVSPEVMDVVPSVSTGGTEDTLIVTVTDALWIDSLICSCNVEATFTYTFDTLKASFTNASQNATEYFWDFGDGTTSIENNPVHTFDSAGTYTITLVGMDAGCLDTAKIKIIVEPIPTTLEIPNVFTPNGDGKNDLFEMKNLPVGAEVVVYNRWGELLFESYTPNNFWDGRTKGGSFVPGGIYFYIIILPEEESKKGIVEVVN